MDHLRQDRDSIQDASASPEEPESSVTPRRTVVNATLQKILRSAPFRNSKQCQDLLRYVVDRSIAGQDQLLRERVIGSEVFGRPPDYDCANDPVVRARMAEVRKRLAQYYSGEAQPASTLRIEIPSGSYKAQFEVVPATETSTIALKEAQTQAEAAPALSPASPSVAPVANRRSPRFRTALIAAALCVLLTVCDLTWAIFDPSPARTLDRFWAPVLHSPMPVLIYTGTNVVYRFTPEFLERYQQAHHLQNNGPEFAVDLSSLKTIDPRDLSLFANTFIGVGDVTACSAIASMLARHDKPFEMRYAGDISPSDVHSAPTVLIGGFSNNWTLDVTGATRYSFVRGTTIEDRFDRRHVWSIRTTPDGSTLDDYAVISRILDPKNHGFVLTAAGIGQYGTQAASEYLINPQEVAAFAKRAPKGWDRRNVQIVLHVKVANEIPGSINIVALYFW